MPFAEPFIKSQERRFAGNHLADQHGDKIDEIVVTKAGTSEAHLLLDRSEDALVGENLCKGGDFSQPGRR